MLDKIIAQLKTGRITNVVPYGSANTPAPPYIVVRPEADGLGRGTVYRIFVHMIPGQQIFLDDFVRGDLTDLLSDFHSTTRHGGYNRLFTEQQYGDIVVSNDDGTISMERRFLMPSMMF